VTKSSFKRFVEAVSTLDSRKDSHLNDYFVQTDTYKLILGEGRNVELVVGLKGSGKTSLYNILTSQSTKDKIGTVSIGISPSDAHWAHQIENANILQFAESAKMGLALYILRHLQSPIDEINDKIRIKNELFRPVLTLLDRLKGLQGISIFGCGINLKVPDEIKKQEFKAIGKNESAPAIKLLKSIVDSGYSINIVTDDADRIFGGESLNKHLLGGFILGCSDLKNEIDGITIVHIVKSHVKELLDSIEEFTNRSTRLTTYISWSDAELVELLKKRLKYSKLQWNDVFSISKEDFVEVVSPRLRNGPRDLLRYVDLILQRKVFGEKIGKADFDDVADDYRELAYQQMQVVYGDVFSNVGEFVRELFKGSKTLDLSNGQTEYAKMRLESRPNASIYSQRGFSSFQRALISITDSGCVDINDGNRWVQPYRREYFEAISKKRVAKLRLNYAIEIVK